MPLKQARRLHPQSSGLTLLASYRDSLYWPCMATERKEYISKCDVCLAHRSTPGKEPLLSHELVARPWSKVAADLCELDGRTLLVISDYYSNFIEVARLNSVTSRSVIKEMKDVFARYGIPDVLVTDNGAQFASAEFAIFAETWSFEHHTSSPRYPQSNGKAENAVQTVKRLFTKCKASGQSEYLALLDWRNTPTEGVGTSPAQRLFVRKQTSQVSLWKHPCNRVRWVYPAPADPAGAVTPLLGRKIMS